MKRDFVKVGVLFSGGKDSTLASHILHSSGFDVFLYTFIPKNKDSYMLHSKALNVVRLQAKAMSFPIKIFYVSGEKEKEVYEMLDFLKGEGLDAIASGALASEYQKQRIDFISHNLGIPSFSPLWHRYPYFDYEQMNIIFSSVSAHNLRKELLGKNALPFLEKYNFFEGGDAETLVLDAPFFNSRLSIHFSILWKGDCGEIEIKKAWLVEK